MRWWLVAIAVSIVITYANSLDGPFFVDDAPTVVDNAAVHDWSHLRELLHSTEETPVTSRPLAGFSFLLNYVAGGEDVRGYHLWNVGVHLLAALLLFGVVRRTLELPRLRGRFGARANPTAFCVALLWAVHPLNTEAVDYLTQRTESMMGLFYLATLYASVRAVDRPGWRWAATAVACCAAGMACKESMITAPLAVWLFDRVFVFDSARQALRARWRLYAGLAATWALLAALVASAPPMRSAGFATSVGVWTYLLNQTVMIVRYLRLSVWPTSLVVNYGWPLPLRLADVWPQAIVVVALLVATLIALVKRPALGFIGAWFFLTLAPTSSFMPIATEVGAERRMYLPLIAMSAVVVLAVVGTKVPVRRGWIIVTAVAVALMTGTILRNREYRSGLTLAQTAVDRWPSSVGEHVLGVQWMLAGNITEAAVHLQRAVPGAPRAYFSLGAIEFRQEHWDAAIRDLRAFIDAQPQLLEVISARLYLAQALVHTSRFDEAIEQARLAVATRGSRDDVLDALLVTADALRSQGSFEAAVHRYQRYVQARPNDVQGATGLAISLVGLNRTADAATWFTRAADLKPHDSAMQRNAAMALLEVHRVDAAAVYAERAARLRPSDDLAHDVFGQLLLAQGKSAAAIEQFELARRLNPNDADIRAHLDQARRFTVRLAPTAR